jgi:L-alanine-DL-glutamate epimerase-like enolase superfamily enzyme
MGGAHRPSNGKKPMRITKIRTTPLFCKFKQPYHWAQGVTLGAPVILIEVETDGGIIGIGESVASPTIEPVLAIIQDAIPHFIGQSIYDGNRLIADYYRLGFNARGTGSALRYFSQAMAGIELALWDAIGKAAGQPLHRILGGAVRDKVEYFGFVQGDKPAELARHASALVKQGFGVLYVKVGRGEALDLEIVRAVRKAVGSTRIRLDANEVWDTMTARRMFEKLKPFDPEFIEQPVPGPGGAEALARLRGVVDIPIAADQSVYTPEDVYDICRNRAADVIVLGIHETGGVTRYRKAAAIAEAASIRICIHGVFETGITTCATNQVAATLNNMDDGNQIMWQLLREDIVESPDLTPVNGALPISNKPGLGFELNRDAVERAAEDYRKQKR